MAEILTPDLCIIGASAAGIRLAQRARQYGASVILVQRKAEAGEAAASESVALEALLAAADRAQALRTASLFGMANEEPKPNFRGLHDHIRSVVAQAAPAVAPERLVALGIDLRQGPAAFTDRRTLKLGDVLIRARRFVLATGARIPEPAIKGLDQAPVLTTRSIFDNTRKLSHLVILGRTGEALELAQAYRRLGSAVTIVAAAALLDTVDPELADLARRQLHEDGVVIHEGASVIDVVARSQGVGVNIVHADGSEEALDASHILVAPPPVPDLGGLELDKANVRRDKADPERLALSPTLRTSNAAIFAIGAAANVAQPHAALAQADLVLDNALFGIARPYEPGLVPRLVAIEPGLASIGLSEPEARVRHKTGYSVLRANFAENDKARAQRQSLGLAKLIVGPRGAILGAAVAGAGAAELIAFFAFAMAKGLNAADLAAFVAPHPAYAGMVRQLGEAYAQTRPPDPWRLRRRALAKFLP